MRLVPRTDLGGFASAIPGVASLAEVEIERPFVLLCGPNGSGKTGMLRMIRNAVGLEGPGAGRVADQQFDRAPDPGECGGDLAKLAAFRGSFGKVAPPQRDWAGVLDVRALGWTGQRTWLLDTRADTNLAAASQFVDNDFRRQIGLLMGAKSASHGQLMHHGWVEALEWAAGGATAEDPYDSPRHLPPARQALRDATFVENRPAERWLLLDEPETALDVEHLLVGMSLLLQEARVGRLRVFCASHSPLFAAGLADHPSVQVLDMGGPRRWFDLQRQALRDAADPAKVRAHGEHVAGRMRESARRQEAERAKQRRRKVAEAVSGLGKAAREALLRATAADAPETRPEDLKSRVPTAGRHDLWSRGLTEHTPRGGRLVPTELGIAAAALLRERAARPPRARKAKEPPAGT